MAATKLALSGALEECPDVKIVWSHLGGGLAMILDRIDRGYQRFSSCPQPPSYYLRRGFRHGVHPRPGAGVRPRDGGREHTGFRHGCTACAEHREKHDRRLESNILVGCRPRERLRWDCSSAAGVTERFAGLHSSSRGQSISRRTGAHGFRDLKIGSPCERSYEDSNDYSPIFTRICISIFANVTARACRSPLCDGESKAQGDGTTRVRM
jgi:hypothetical protein